MKAKHAIALSLAALLAVSAGVGCGGGGGQSGSNSSGSTQTTQNNAADSGSSDDTASGDQAITEGKDTNYGRPYNLTPVKYDTRKDKYLNGINATVLPIVEEPVEISIWQSFTSTVMQSLEESEVYKEMEKRTNVKIKWIYPPKGQEADNFNLRVSSDDLPHIFSRAKDHYPGGPAKAVDDGIFVDLTPYYDKGLMPNIQYLRENNDEINRDWVDDEGRMLAFIMLDIVPTSPWSGMWVRGDWLDELGLSVPTTIDEWDTMLYAMKDLKGGTPLSLQVGLKDNWYGLKTNFAFAGSYETGYDFINKDGKIEYGPANEGYRSYLTLLNKWYADGILDSDFVTRTYDDYIANTTSGKYGAFGMAYGDVGQLKLSGAAKDPNFKIVPTLQPTSYDGQEIHLHQYDATVRGARDHMTAQAVDDGVDEIICRYIDYWYSQDGGDLCSYGPEGVSYEWNDEGEVEWIYPDLVNNPDSDFWTLYPRWKLHEGPYLRDSSAYKMEPEVWDCIALWGSQDASWVMPDNRTLTPDESQELATMITDIETYREEMTFKFITGQEPLSNFDSYVSQMEKMNLARVTEINQAVIDRYNSR